MKKLGVFILLSSLIFNVFSTETILEQKNIFGGKTIEFRFSDTESLVSKIDKKIIYYGDGNNMVVGNS